MKCPDMTRFFFECVWQKMPIIVGFICFWPGIIGEKRPEGVNIYFWMDPMDSYVYKGDKFC